MQPQLPAFSRSVLSLALTGLFTLCSASAHASYVVIDDDLMPTAVVEARRNPAPPVVEPDHYTVGFLRFQTTLGPMARAVLDSLVPKMLKADSVHILGRPDAALTAGNDKQQTPIARGRAANIRAYLIKQGVPESNIEVSVDSMPSTQANGGNFPVDIYVTRAEGRMPMQPAPMYPAQQEPAYQQPSRQYFSAPPAPSMQPPVRNPATVYTIPVAPTIAPRQPSSDEQLTQYINQAVQSGQMNPAVALQLLRTMMESRTSPGPAQAQAAPSYAPQAQVAADSWTLDKRFTLRENIDAWAQSVGWNPSTWEASNFYQVTNTVSLGGGFPDVLRKVAESTGLNICPSMRERRVRVTEANVRCDK